MTDLSEHLKAAAVAAIEDLALAVLADPRKLWLLTIELEISNAGTKVTGGCAWLERAVNLRTLLEQEPPVLVGEG